MWSYERAEDDRLVKKLIRSIRKTKGGVKRLKRALKEINPRRLRPDRIGRKSKCGCLVFHCLTQDEKQGLGECEFDNAPIVAKLLTPQISKLCFNPWQWERQEKLGADRLKQLIKQELKRPNKSAR